MSLQEGLASLHPGAEVVILPVLRCGEADLWQGAGLFLTGAPLETRERAWEIRYVNKTLMSLSDFEVVFNGV